MRVLETGGPEIFKRYPRLSNLEISRPGQLGNKFILFNPILTTKNTMLGSCICGKLKYEFKGDSQGMVRKL
jgi:hypothetical protein